MRTQANDLRAELKRVEGLLYWLDKWNDKKHLMNDYDTMWRKYENRRYEIIDTLNNIQ